MSKINENKLFNEVIKDMNNCGNYYQFLQLMQSKYNMSENDVKASGLDKVWCKEKHDRPDYYPGEPDPINENAIRKAVRESLEEISWGTVMKAGEKSDMMSNALMDFGQATYDYMVAMQKFLKYDTGQENSFGKLIGMLRLNQIYKMLDTMLKFLKRKVLRRDRQSNYFKTSATDAEEHYLNKNGVITNYDDIQV